MAPSFFGLTRDSKYAYLASFLSEVALKVRLMDMVVDARADLSACFPLSSYTIALDAAEPTAFVHSAARSTLHVLPNERKLHVGANGGAYSPDHMPGWVHAVDLVTRQVTSITPDGEAQSMDASPDSGALYVGAAQPQLDAGARNYGITAAQSDSGKQFRAALTNRGGVLLTNAATLTVDLAPGIIADPPSQTVRPGATASMAASASGSPAPTVQWQVSADAGATWSDVPGAVTAVYSFTAQASDSGKQFRAVFSNSLSTATSRAATLRVENLPTGTDAAWLRQGMSPSGLVFSEDGSSAYVSLDLGVGIVSRMRLSDLSVIGSMGLSAYFPPQLLGYALNVVGRRLFTYSATRKKVFIVDADTLEVTQTLDDLISIGMIRSRHGARLISWDGGGWVRTIDATTLAVTTETTLDNLFIEKVVEHPDNPAWWFIAARTEPFGKGPILVGIFDHVSRAWVTSVSVPTQESTEGLSDLAAVPGDGKLYLGTFGGWHPVGDGYGWLYAVDLARKQTTVTPIGGGVMTFGLRTDLHRLYVGTGWPLKADEGNLLVFDTRSDTAVGEIRLGRSPYGWPRTQISAIQPDPGGAPSLYVASVDSNCVFRVNLDTGALERETVLNHEDVPSQEFARRPGGDSGFIVLRNRQTLLDFDLARGRVTRSIALPIVPAWSYGLAASSDRRLFATEGNNIVEIDETNPALSTSHALPPTVYGLWGMRLSGDERFLYTTAQSPPGGMAPNASVFHAVSTTTFDVKARIPLADVPHAWRPFELPDQKKIYVLGGEAAGPVTLDVIESASFTWQKRITFDQPGLLGISTGSSDPYAYDPATHTLYVGATYAILAIDTITDTIVQVIRLSDIESQVGIEGSRLTFINPVALLFNPKARCLYAAHLDGGFVSVYDTVAKRFVAPLISVQGIFPGRMVASSDFSRIYTLNDRSDSVTVIDTASKAVVDVIDLQSVVQVVAPGAPVVSVPPASRTVQVGAVATFYAIGVNPRPGSPGPTVQWQVSANAGGSWSDVAGATSSSFSLSPVAIDNGKWYRAVFTNPAGSSVTAAATLTVTNPAPAIAAVVPASGPLAGAITATIQGTWFLPGAAVTFGGTAAASVTVDSAASLTVIVPAHVAGSVDVVVRNADGQTASMPGAFTYTADPHPADADGDGKLVIGEITAYGAAWKRGDFWPRGLNPIPIGHVTRGGFLWRSGEFYQQTTSDCPACWVSGTSSDWVQHETLEEKRTTGLAPGRWAQADVDGPIIPGGTVGVVIVLTPSPTARSCALEDHPPDGWTVSDVSPGGTWDPVRRLARWGATRENGPRTVSYRLTVPATVTVPGPFVGRVSCDGVDSGISGTYRIDITGKLP